MPVPIMGPQPQRLRPQTRPRGPSEEPQGRHASTSTYASHNRFSSSSDLWKDEFSPYLRNDASDHRYNETLSGSYAQSLSDKDLGLHSQSRSSGNYYTTYDENSHYQEIYRSQAQQNPAIYRMLNDPRIMGLDQYPAQGGYAASQSRHGQPQPTSNEYGSQEYQHNNRPLGRSNLKDLNRNRSPVHTMAQRRFLAQREEPYDAVGYVGRRSDYDNGRA